MFKSFFLALSSRADSSVIGAINRDGKYTFGDDERVTLEMMDLLQQDH